MEALARLIRTIGYALAGLASMFRTERNARLHALGAVVLVALSTWAGLGRLEWALVAAGVLLVLSAEAMNTAVETVVDHVQPEWHEAARRAKDVAAGAVLLAFLFEVAVAAIVVLPALLDRG